MRAALRHEGIEAARTPLSPLGLRVFERIPLATLDVFRERADRGAGRRLAARGAARRCAAGHARRRFLRRRRRQDAGARRRRWTIAATSSPATSRSSGSSARRSGCAAPASASSSAVPLVERARQMGEAPRRRASTASSSTRPAPAPAPGGAIPMRNGGCSPKTSPSSPALQAEHPRQRGAAGEAGRPADLRHLLAAARGERGADRALPRRRTRISRCCRSAPVWARDDRRRAARPRATCCA